MEVGHIKLGACANAHCKHAIGLTLGVRQSLRVFASNNLLLRLRPKSALRRPDALASRNLKAL